MAASINRAGSRQAFVSSVTPHLRKCVFTSKHVSGAVYIHVHEDKSMKYMKLKSNVHIRIPSLRLCVYERPIKEPVRHVKSCRVPPPGKA